jgi:hypothetical protein
MGSLSGTSARRESVSTSSEADGRGRDCPLIFCISWEGACGGGPTHGVGPERNEGIFNRGLGHDSLDGPDISGFRVRSTHAMIRLLTKRPVWVPGLQL